MIDQVESAIEGLDGMMGGLVKMTIEKWSEKESLFPSFSSEAFTLMLNPEQYSETFRTEYDKGRSKCQRIDPKPKAEEESVYSFDFIIDGTGATGLTVDVASKIKKFRKLVESKNEDQMTNKLRLKWGTLHMNCVFLSATINYTLFSRTGRPLRAKITAKFQQVRSLDASWLAQKEQVISRVLGAGQNIVSLATKTYGAANKIAKLAKANNLNSFRKLDAGVKVLLPPKIKL